MAKITLDDFKSDASEESITKNEEEPNVFQKVQYYNNEYICLSDAQQNIVNQSMPMVLSGMAGSGKTCIGFALLQNFIQQNSGTHARILYTTYSEHLAKTMQKIWNDCNDYLNHSTIKIEFLSYADLIGRNSELKKLKFIDFSDFELWYKNQKIVFDVTQVYEEFKIICLCHSFEEYNERFGVRSCYFSERDNKKSVYDLYQRYQEYCQVNQLMDSVFLPVNLKEWYDYIFVDESQNLSHQQLCNLLTFVRDQQICFAMDSNQKYLQGNSIRPFLLQLLSQQSHLNTVHYNLSQTFRNPPNIVLLANAVLRIKNAIIGGVTDIHEYTQAIANDENQEPGMVHTGFSSATPELIGLTSNVDCGVVVAVEADKQQAFELFKTPLIFTPEEIQGLQYANIILFEPLATSAFAQINKLIPDDIAERSLIKNRPKNKDEKINHEFIPILNGLYIAITRASKSVYMVAKKNHATVKITQQLQQACKSVENKVMQPVESSALEWENAAINLEAVGKKSQAHAIYKMKLKKSSPLKKTTVVSIPVEKINASSSVMTIIKSEVSLEQAKIDDFINQPNPEKLHLLVMAEDATKLIYKVRSSSGITLVDAMRQDIWKYLSAFLCVDSATVLFHILISDERVQQALKMCRKNFFSEEIFGRFCTSSVGWVILSRAMTVNTKLKTDILEGKTCFIF